MLTIPSFGKLSHCYSSPKVFRPSLAVKKSPQKLCSQASKKDDISITDMREELVRFENGRAFLQILSRLSSLASVPATIPGAILMYEKGLPLSPRHQKVLEAQEDLSNLIEQTFPLGERLTAVRDLCGSLDSEFKGISSKNSTAGTVEMEFPSMRKIMELFHEELCGSSSSPAS